MHDVFISYARKDLDTARRLADALGRQGWSIWWDHRLLAGEVFNVAIQQALDASLCVIVLWSEDSVASGWVLDEAEAAKQRGILVPAHIDGTRIPLGFGRIHTEDLVGWDGNPEHAGFERLIRAVARVLGTAAEKKNAVAEEPSDSQRPADSTPIRDEKPEEADPIMVETAPGASSSTKERIPSRRLEEPAKKTGAGRAALWVLAGLLLVVVGIVGVRTGFWTPASPSVEPPVVDLGAEEAGKIGASDLAHQEDLKQQISELYGLTMAQRVPICALHGISTALPDLAWLETVRLRDGGLTLDGKSLNTNAIAVLVENLDKVSGFTSVQAKGIKKEKDLYRFSMDITLEPGPLTGLASQVGLDTEADGDVSGLKLRERIENLEKSLDESLGRLPTRRNVEDLARRLRALVDQADLDLVVFSPSVPADLGLLLRWPLSLELHGSFHAMAQFLDGLARWRIIVVSETLEITSVGMKSGDSAIKLQLSIPLAKDESSEQRRGVPDGAAGDRVTGLDEMPPPADPGGKRDPFRSVAVERSRADTKPDGVAGILIDDIVVQGIFELPEGLVAQILSSKGVTSYLLREGDQLWDGEVVKIELEAVEFKQVVKDPIKGNSFRSVVKRLNPS